MTNDRASILRRLLRAAGPFLGLAAVWTLFAALVGAPFSVWDNQRLMLMQTAVVGCAAIGSTIIIIAGGIDLSVGSSIALGTMVVAWLLRAGHAPTVAALGGVLCGATAGATIGLFITRFRLSPFIASLGLWGALRGLAKGLGKNQPIYLNDGQSAGWIEKLLVVSPDVMIAGLPIGVWMLIGLAAVAAILLNRTVFGRTVFAIGSNEETARLCGIAVERTKFFIYVIGVGCAGIAALLQFSYLSMGDPTTAQGYELKTIAAAVIGGASLAGGEGSIAGTLAGAFIMTIVDNGCTKLGLDNWVQEVVTGAIIVLAVLIDRMRRRTNA